MSRPMEEILDEVKYLVARGVKEFQVIAQELTYYGVDLYKRQMLPQLIEKSQKFRVWNGYVCIMLIRLISRWIYSA